MFFLLFFWFFIPNLNCADIFQIDTSIEKFIYNKPIKSLSDFRDSIIALNLFFNKKNISKEEASFHLGSIFTNYCKRTNYLDHIKILIEAGFNINTLILYTFDQETETCITPLTIAILCSNLEVTKFLLERGAELNNLCGDTPMTLAINYNELKIFHMLRYKGINNIEKSELKPNLIQKGQSLSLTPKYSQSYVYEAYSLFRNSTHYKFKEHANAVLYQLYLFGDIEIAQQLLKCPDNQKRQIEEVKQLFNAVKSGSNISGNMSIVKKFAKYIPLELVDENYNTLIDIAIKNHDKSMIATLWLQNKDTLGIFAQTNWEGTNAIQRAMLNGYENMVKFICIFYEKERKL